MPPSHFAQVPEEARDLDKQLRALLKEKEAAVRGQDFEKAGQLRDSEMELKAKIQAIVSQTKEDDKAEQEGETEGAMPTVHEEDIANIVAQWTKIPVEKVGWYNTKVKYVVCWVRFCGV